MIQTILKYFPSLSEDQQAQLDTLGHLLAEWNEKINVISRKDIENVEINHLLHSLAIYKFINFTPGSRVMDLGCGGGLPGLPLAIVMPEVEFYLVDRIGKKIKVAQEIAQALGLNNVVTKHGDSGEAPRTAFDFVVSRAVMNFTDLYKAAKPHICAKQRNAFPNGLITLKGGELSQELGRFKSDTLIEPLREYFPAEPFFDTKALTYTPIR